MHMCSVGQNIFLMNNYLYFLLIPTRYQTLNLNLDLSYFFRMVGLCLKHVFRPKKILLVCLLMILSFLVMHCYFLVMRLSHCLWPVDTFFQPSISPKDKTRMLETFKTLTQALTAANLTYFAYGGTLLSTMVLYLGMTTLTSC